MFTTNVNSHCFFPNWSLYIFLKQYSKHLRMVDVHSRIHSQVILCILQSTDIHVFCQNLSNLESPRNIVTDNRGNIYVVGHRSNNLHRLTSDGIALDIPQSSYTVYITVYRYLNSSCISASFEGGAYTVV
jgi:hypothetical protein